MERFFIGSLASLFSAASWALGTVLFSKINHRVTPFGLNLGRGLAGLCFLGIPLLFWGHPWADVRSMGLLGLSGLLGIAIGDTLFFKTLLNLGPRLTALMGVLVPVAAALSAMCLLRERPDAGVWGGIVMISAGVGWVLWEKQPSENEITTNKAQGFLYGVLFIAASTGAAVLAKIGVEKVSTLTAVFIRIGGGVAGLLVWGLLKGRIKTDLMPFQDAALLKNFLFIVLIGAYGGFWLFLVSLKYIDLGMASSLNSTSALFVLPMAAMITKEKISRWAAAGTLIAVLGVILIIRSHS